MRGWLRRKGVRVVIAVKPQWIVMDVANGPAGRIFAFIRLSNPFAHSSSAITLMKKEDSSCVSALRVFINELMLIGIIHFKHDDFGSLLPPATQSVQG